MAYISLPVVTVQRDFNDVVRDVDEGVVPVDTFWVSCYKSGESSVHAKVDVELDEVDRNLLRFRSKEGDVDFVKSDSVSGYSIACRSLDIPPTAVVLPIQEYNDSERTNPLRPQRITAFDVSPDTTRFATGHLDGSVVIYPSASTSIQQVNTSKCKLVSKAHVSNVSSLTFFPSSRVLLSTGADFSLSILSSEFPESWSESSSGLGTRVNPVRVLRAHTRGVTSACILGLGRNIISSSLDKTLRLWDVPTGDVIHTLEASAPILCTSNGPRTPTPPDGEDTPLAETQDEREMPEVAHTLTYTGLQSGSFEVFDLGTRISIYKSPSAVGGSPINAISILPAQHLLATGAGDGVVTLYDVRSLSSPLTSFRRNDAGINDLDFSPGSTNSECGLAIATTDGLPYVASIIPEGPGVSTELIGVDCDPVQSVRVRNKSEIWSASDDAIVRRYIL
ncbi:WD40 repeat-like protein [Macrolepiota fuliginosa MF-IS2]|uniref:WD40 repeat-like protein n=1 Tax=Macrolepiota fuliginosa MF-IS2 TaxID=1400762 RepID=A0A9P6BYL6_9AGAR|nr:WD40 repeat-like protein [Macrolepiota fuliginosa MF-IS2]